MCTNNPATTNFQASFKSKKEAEPFKQKTNSQYPNAMKNNKHLWLFILILILSSILSDPAQANLPLGLDCDNSSTPVCSVTLSNTIRFEAPLSQIEIDSKDGSFTMSGSVKLNSPAGKLTLTDSQIVFQANDTLESFPFDTYGFVTASLPAPLLFENASSSFQPRAAIEIVSRQTLQSMFAQNPLPLAKNFHKDKNGKPILREAAYILLYYEAVIPSSLTVKKGTQKPFNFEIPSRSLTFILDPADPYFFSGTINKNNRLIK